jgi:hypothetical protein
MQAPSLVAERALGWIDRHLDRFDPFAGAQPFEVKRGQRIGELAILLVVLHGVRGERDSPRVRRIIALLEGIRDHAEFSDRLLRSPLEFVLFAEVYARLRAVGHDSARMRALLRRGIQANLLGQTERVPHRLMDIRSCLQLADIPCPLPSLRALFEQSILGRPPNLLLMSEDDFYALTHVIMFQFDFGRRPPDTLPAARRAGLAPLLAGIIPLVLRDRHWDLLAEMLICWDCLHLGPHALVAQAWTALQEAQEEDGRIAGPEWVRRDHAAREDTLPPDVWRDLVFTHHYHTTLVCALAGMLSTARGSDSNGAPPPVRWQKPETRRAWRQRQVALSPAVRPAARLAHDWLQEAAAGLVDEDDAIAAPVCLTALGLWICQAIDPATHAPASETIRRLGERLALVDRHRDPGWTMIAPSLAVMAAALFGGNGARIPYLHAPEGFVERVRLAVASARAHASATMTGGQDSHRDGDGANGTLEELSALLQAVGRGERPADGAAEAEDGTRTARRSRRRDAVTRRQDPASDAALNDAIAALRQYDLLTGAARLRLAAREAPRDRASATLIAEGVAFLLLQQRPEGDFGFFAPDWRRAQPTRPAAWRDRDARVSTTVECLWTLAEVACGDWRLVESLPAPAVRGRSASPPCRR